MVTVEGNKYISIYSHEVTVEAVVIADPPVTFVYWEKVANNRKTIINNGAVGIEGVAPTNPSLIIKYGTKADNGIYRCFATNDVGTSHSNVISLQVTGGNTNDFPSVLNKP